MRALVIESSSSYQSVLNTIFAEAGFRVVNAGSGEEGLALATKERFDLVCSALQLDDMDGDELVKQLHAQPQNRHMPIVMLTSEQDREIFGRVLQAGIIEIYRKSDTQRLSDYLNYFYLKHCGGGVLNGRILYVEDDQAIAELIMLYLEAMGLTVDHFVEGESALKAFNEADYDLVLTDFLLQGEMTGSDLLRKVRSLPAKKARVPVLMVSGFSDEARTIELLKSGANDYVSKPVIREELEVRVQNLVSNKQMLDRIEAQQQRLQRMAMTDQLTGLYNRYYLFEQMPKEISEASRHNFPLALVEIDLDHFKAINDNHGHAVGDEVLKSVGGMLRECCRKEDMLARFGGEEFVILLTHCDHEGAEQKSEEIRRSLMALQPAGLKVTASLGVAVLDPASPMDFAELFAAADKALYLAKEGGRNCVVFADSEGGRAAAN